MNSDVCLGVIAGCVIIITLAMGVTLVKVTSIDQSVQSIEARFYGHR